MKKILSILMCLTILFCAVSCSASKSDLVDTGLEVIDMMLEVADDSIYIDTMARGDESTLNIVKSVKRGSYDEPHAVFEIKVPHKEVGSYFGSDYSKLSKEMKLYYQARLYDSIAPALNSLQGMYYVTTASILYSSKAVDKELSDSVAYLYIFEESIPVMVIFNANGDGAINAYGYFIFYDISDDCTVDELEETLKYAATLSEVNVKKIR